MVQFYVSEFHLLGHLDSGGKGADGQPQRAGHEVLHHDDQHKVQETHTSLELHQTETNRCEVIKKDIY